VVDASAERCFIVVCTLKAGVGGSRLGSARSIFLRARPSFVLKSPAGSPARTSVSPRRRMRMRLPLPGIEEMMILGEATQVEVSRLLFALLLWGNARQGMQAGTPPAKSGRNTGGKCLLQRFYVPVQQAEACL